VTDEPFATVWPLKVQEALGGVVEVHGTLTPLQNVEGVTVTVTLALAVALPLVHEIV
jgi:hypothetical protein